MCCKPLNKNLEVLEELNTLFSDKAIGKNHDTHSTSHPVKSV